MFCLARYQCESVFGLDEPMNSGSGRRMSVTTEVTQAKRVKMSTKLTVQEKPQPCMSVIDCLNQPFSRTEGRAFLLRLLYRKRTNEWAIQCLNLAPFWVTQPKLSLRKPQQFAETYTKASKGKF